MRSTADRNQARNQLSFALLALIVSALAFYYGTGLHPTWWLMWLGPIPILLLASRLKWTVAFLVSFVAWAAGATNLWFFYHAVLRLPSGVIAAATLVPAMVFAIAVLAYRSVLRTSIWRAAFIFPSIWVFWEFVSERLSIHGTYGNTSYSQMNFLPILQIASITGIWGISFCLFQFASTISVLLSRGDMGAKRRVAVACATLFIVVIGFGVWRLAATPAAQQSVTVGLLASDLPQNIVTERPADTLRLLSEYADQAKQLAAQGAKVIIIPEKVSVFLDSDLPKFDNLLRTTAQQTGALIVIGVIHPTNGPKWNEARLYAPDGTIRTYAKHHMLPPFESSFTIGTSRTEWQEPSGRWGMTICKDMDFPRLSREYGLDGTALLLVPAWDFRLDGWLHGRMAILRSVESGFSMARAPNMGVMTVSDDRGRVLAQRSTASAPFASLLASVPVRHDDTIYARFGDWFGWLNIVLLASLIVMGLRTRSRLSRREVNVEPSREPVAR